MPLIMRRNASACHQYTPNCFDWCLTLDLLEQSRVTCSRAGQQTGQGTCCTDEQRTRSSRSAESSERHHGEIEECHSNLLHCRSVARSRGHSCSPPFPHTSPCSKKYTFVIISDILFLRLYLVDFFSFLLSYHRLCELTRATLHTHRS